MALLALLADSRGHWLHGAQQELVGETSIRQARGRRNEECHVGGDRFAIVLRGAEPRLARGNRLRQERFLDWRLAHVDLPDLLRVNVNADNLEPALGQGSRDAGAELA